MTEYQKHLHDWKNCRRCLLCKGRTNTVLARGKIPADVLFIGEAPGASEDILGKPFSGPAGYLLEEIVQAGSSGKDVRVCFTNLVGCIPLGANHVKENEPPEIAIKECLPRISDLIRLCQPKLIVTVGKLAEKHVPEVEDCLRITILHPASILRLDISQRSLAIKRCVVMLSDALVSLFSKGSLRA